MRDRPSWIADVASVIFVLALFGAVYLLPPDTSLATIRSAGVLRVCMPPNYPPLVTTDAAAPGLDVELVRLIGERLGLRVAISTNDAISRDFNPRSWRLTRAQCQLIAGGVVASATTRSFLDTTPPHIDTGWAIVSPEPVTGLQGTTVGFYAGLSGLDRVALASYLQREGATVRIAGSRGAIINGINAGLYSAGVTEAILARQIAGDLGWHVYWLPESLGRYPVSLGVWKGDLTLKRAINAVLAELEAEGVVNQLIAKYEIAPIENTIGAAASQPGAP